MTDSNLPLDRLIPALAAPAIVDSATGSAEEIQRYLAERRKASKYLIVELSDNAPPAQVLTTLLDQMAALIGSSQADVDREAREALFRVMLPKTPPNAQRMIELRMAGESRKAILNSGNWLNSKEIAGIAGLSSTNPASQPNKWKRDGLIFAIHHNGVDLYPDYALDPGAGYRPRPVIARIIGIFGNTRDAWGLASWFLAANSRLGGHRPQDVVATEPDLVIAAAERSLVGVQHG